MSGQPLAIAVVMAAPFPALQGSQVLVRQMAEGLARRGHRVHLVAYGAASDALPVDVRVHRIPRLWGCRTTASGPHPGKVILDILLTAKLRDVVRREGIDVLHAHNYEGAIASLIVGKLTSRPVVYHGHSAMADELPTYFSGSVARFVAAKVGRWLDGNVPRRADYCIGVSDHLVNVLRARGVSEDGVKCVLPGSPEVDGVDGGKKVDNWRDRFGPRSGPLLLYAGNLDGYQNLEFLLKSFARVRASRPDARLLVVTHGEGRRYRRRAHEIGREAVRVLEVRTFPEAWSLIEAADIAVCPRTEATGFPMKLLNYMAAAKPIVACEGSAKMLRHGETALVVPNGDEAAFAAAVVELLDHPAKRLRLGAGARHAVRALCDWETMVDRVEGVYMRVLARRGHESGRTVVTSVGLSR